MVMLSPLGTSGTYFDTGSSRPSLPSWASCRTTTAVIVLVFEAIRKWVFASGGLCTPSWVVPDAAVKSPCGVLSTTTAPGISCCLMVLSTRTCNAAPSMGLSPDDVDPVVGLSGVGGNVVEAGVDPVIGAEFATVVAVADGGSAAFPLPHAAVASRRATAAPVPRMARRCRGLIILPVEPNRVMIIYLSSDRFRGVKTSSPLGCRRSVLARAAGLAWSGRASRG